jgi:hypothetical protein
MRGEGGFLFLLGGAAVDLRTAAADAVVVTIPLLSVPLRGLHEAGSKEEGEFAAFFSLFQSFLVPPLDFALPVPQRKEASHTQQHA